eukprot:350621-Chlamydomonas_euryale.AAC.1
MCVCPRCNVQASSAPPVQVRLPALQRARPSPLPPGACASAGLVQGGDRRDQARARAAGRHPQGGARPGARGQAARVAWRPGAGAAPQVNAGVWVSGAAGAQVSSKWCTQGLLTAGACCTPASGGHLGERCLRPAHGWYVQQFILWPVPRCAVHAGRPRLAGVAVQQLAGAWMSDMSGRERHRLLLAGFRLSSTYAPPIAAGNLQPPEDGCAGDLLAPAHAVWPAGGEEGVGDMCPGHMDMYRRPAVPQVLVRTYGHPHIGDVDSLVSTACCGSRYQSQTAGGPEQVAQYRQQAVMAGCNPRIGLSESGPSIVKTVDVSTVHSDVMGGLVQTSVKQPVSVAGLLGMVLCPRKCNQNAAIAHVSTCWWL